MGEYGGQTQQREFKKDKISVMHYNEKEQTYKSLAVNPVPDKKDVVFFSMREGKKGEKQNRITLALNKNEIAYLIMDLTKMYNQDLE